MRLIVASKNSSMPVNWTRSLDFTRRKEYFFHLIRTNIKGEKRSRSSGKVLAMLGWIIFVWRRAPCSKPDQTDWSKRVPISIRWIGETFKWYGNVCPRERTSGSWTSIFSIDLLFIFENKSSLCWCADEKNKLSQQWNSQLSPSHRLSMRPGSFQCDDEQINTDRCFSGHDCLSMVQSRN